MLGFSSDVGSIVCYLSKVTVMIVMYTSYFKDWFLIGGAYVIARSCYMSSQAWSSIGDWPLNSRDKDVLLIARKHPQNPFRDLRDYSNVFKSKSYGTATLPTSLWSWQTRYSLYTDVRGIHLLWPLLMGSLLAGGLCIWLRLENDSLVDTR